MNIILGSTSPQEIAAVITARDRIGLTASVTDINAYTGQNKQPVDFEQTFAGALARAKVAQNSSRLNFDATCIGIESGMFYMHGNGVVLDIAVVVILTPGNRRIVTTSQGLLLPNDCVSETVRRGLHQTTVGEVIAEKLGGDPSDPHSTLTSGKITRMQTLSDAVFAAFCSLQL